MALPLLRRDVLRALLGAPFAGALLPGCDDEPAAPDVEGALLGPSMELGHRLRDGDLTDDAWRGAPVERVPVAILGGGPAGLAAAWRLSRRGFEGYRVVELEPRPGGTSAWGEGEVTPYPWGAHYLPLPMAHNADLIALLREVGAVVGTDSEGEPVGAEHMLVREPAERVFYGGYWYRGLYPYAGASEDDIAQLARFRALLDRWVAFRDGRDRRAFAIPLRTASDDPEVWALDQITAREWLDRHGLTSPRLRWLAAYACRDDYALDLDEASAWALLFYWASRMRTPGADTQELLAWSEGNGRLVRHMASVAGPRLETGKLVADVVPGEEGVRVHLLDAATGRPEVLEAGRVVVAMPRFIARRVLRPLREDDPHGSAFAYGAWMVANLHLRDRPGGRGFAPAWDNVLYDSPSLGYVSATHQGGRDHGPTVWTYYRPFTGDPGEARRRLLDVSWDEWREAVVRDLRRAHPDLDRHLHQLDVWRWGHAMIQPRVGFVSSAGRRAAARPLERVHFGHSDLSGVALFEEAFDHGLRAADEVLAARDDGGSAGGGSTGGGSAGGGSAGGGSAGDDSAGGDPDRERLPDPPAGAGATGKVPS